jgi:hypothetical protein
MQAICNKWAPPERAFLMRIGGSGSDLRACITNVWRWCYLIEHRVQWSQRSSKAMSVGFTHRFCRRSHSCRVFLCGWGGGALVVTCKAGSKREKDSWMKHRARKSCCVLSVCCAGWLTSSLTGHNRQRSCVFIHDSFCFLFSCMFLNPSLVRLHYKYILSSLLVGTHSCGMYILCADITYCCCCPHSLVVSRHSVTYFFLHTCS